MSASHPNSAARPAPGAGEIVDIVRTVAYALAIALVLRVVVFEPFTIPSDSMEPTVQTGDYIITSKYSYGWSRCSLPFNPPLFHGRVLGRGPGRGDVVVFKLPRDESITYIKRVIGLPGDRVRVSGGVVVVNGKAMPRTFVGRTQDPGMPAMTVMEFQERRPDGVAYTTFDRGGGHDGDDTGVYLVPQGQYFVMGDNRDNSLDSRWPSQVGVGFVPAENIVGRAQFILASWPGGASILKPWTWVSRFDAARMLRRVS